jgi:hypothetical protein
MSDGASLAVVAGDSRLRGQRLLLARVVWVAVALLTLALFIASLWPYYQSLITFSSGQINDPRSVQSGLDQLGVSGSLYAAYILIARVAFAIVYLAVALRNTD